MRLDSPTGLPRPFWGSSDATRPRFAAIVQDLFPLPVHCEMGRTASVGTLNMGVSNVGFVPDPEVLLGGPEARRGLETL